MKTLGLLCALLAGGLSVGCSVGHDFTLADLDTLSIGASRREDVERVLGKPVQVGHPLPHVLYRSRSLETTPPFLLALLTWPVFWATRDEEFDVTVRYDERDVLKEMSLTIQGGSRAFILLIIQPHLLAPTLDRKRLDELRRLQSKGARVEIEAYFGKLTVDEFENSFRGLVDESAPANEK